MPARKPFLLRIDPEVLAALQRWAGDELRSVNGQIEFILRRALQREGRLPVRGQEELAASTSPAEADGRRPAAAADGAPEDADS